MHQNDQIITACIFLVLLIVQVISATGPHISCYWGYYVLQCTEGNYSIPNNFLVHKMPLETRQLELGRPSLEGALHYSIIEDSADPLPSNLTRLMRLDLHSFAGANGARLPVEKFLANVKGTLWELRIQYCRIVSLGADFLRGFKKLEILYLVQNDISVIEATAFETGFTPLIGWIHLTGNQIAHLDWTVFAPVAKSLKNLYLDDQFGDISGRMFAHNVSVGMQTVTLSQRFTFSHLKFLDLSRNALNFLSRDILDTLNTGYYAQFLFDDNAFCPIDPTHSCSCCEARTFVQWMYEVSTRPVLQISFSCGGDVPSKWEAGNIYGVVTSLPPLNQYESCTNATMENIVQ
ncbi:uncharacterized protein LOC129596365 [Paramacrobiotus metropolitanus]|uniref:uncharacterized protein LOC129596365 n=1 Tax=Paramacrobiotus metropolitanus TaxID=2943436 RepID=UPI002445761B|nr:uncharacterized protein LOC129596365 [Paramacrobiotus metropolitanus]